ncbi:hypothetical protein QMK17_17615 [Rhodococcus sp. G-MC3]|uniref:hypothetical protein n=1 Tax=Rhodococcus sp. G-MC3 TaxID=3046209 RepID=UPI0024B99A81|nr:hypothetical protein [Rhodococcus sp. G-MC3]MDJ0395146.1 hypothetical protein [Rhodococcus sp. G-MC3]
MNRLTYDDDLFLRMECVLGVPVVNQIVWQFDTVISTEDLSSAWHNLAAGPINRAVRRARIPGARDTWVGAGEPLPLAVDGIRSAARLSEWIQQKANVNLDPETGPVWQLAFTEFDTGGCAVSLVASHVVGDGGALTSAAIAALRGPGDPEDFKSAWGESEVHDLRDAASQLCRAAAGSARALGRGIRSAVSRAKGGERTPSTPRGPSPVEPSASGPFTPSTVVVDSPTKQWVDAATRAGGSANSLLVAVALGILTSSGRIGESDPVKVSLPVSTRVAGDVRANATSGVSIMVEGGGGFRSDLGPVRRDSKKAFTTLADTSHSTTFELTKPLMQMLPDAIVAKAAQSATAPLCLCSNLGDRGVALRSIGGAEAGSVAMRSITQNTTVELLRRTRGGVSVWWNTSGETSTLCVTGLDPDLFPNAEHLKKLVADEYDRWQLTATFW